MNIRVFSEERLRSVFDVVNYITAEISLSGLAQFVLIHLYVFLKTAGLNGYASE